MGNPEIIAALSARMKEQAGLAEPEATRAATIAASLMQPLSWLSPDHGALKVCPGCGQGDLDVVGLHKLAYVFDTCTCGTPEYPHLVEQLWHREHIGRTPEPVAATARREALAGAMDLIKREARRPESDAPPRQQLTYKGGLRRAVRLLQNPLGEALAAEERYQRIEDTNE